MGNLTHTLALINVSFKCVDEMPIEHLRAYFNFTQEGTGTPSPSNIRNIGGYTGITIAHEGDNSQATSYSVVFNNTYYKGYYDLITGQLTLLYKLIVFDGSEDESWNVESGDNFYIWLSDATQNHYNVCNMAEYTYDSLAPGKCKITPTLNFNLKIGSLINISTVADFKTWLSTNNVQLLYKLATPITIQLTPAQTVNTYIGQNYIYNNSGGVTEVTYQFKDYLAEKKFALNEPHIATSSIQGDFKTDMRANLEEMKIYFEPHQMGVGTPHAAGKGKNIYDPVTYPLKQGYYIGGWNGVIADASNFAATEEHIPISKYAGQTVTLNKRPGGTNPGIAFYTKNDDTYTYLSGFTNNDTAAGISWTFEIPAEAEYMRFTVPANATNIQIELGSESTDFDPYSNERNFVQDDSIMVRTCGKNIYDAETYPLSNNYIIIGTNGSLDYGNQYNSGTQDYIPIKNYAGKILTLNKRPRGQTLGIAFYIKRQGYYYFFTGLKNNEATSGTPWTFQVPIGAEYMRFTAPLDATDVQIELGTSATTYEPYIQKQELYIPIALGKNLFNSYNSVQFQSTNLRVARNYGIGQGHPFHMQAGVTYTVSTNGSSQPNEISIQKPYAGTNYAVAYHGDPVTYTPTEDTDVAFNAYWVNGRPSNATDFQVEVGSTKTSYEPFCFGCGGVIDLLAGTITYEWELARARWGDIKVTNDGQNADTGYWHGVLWFKHPMKTITLAEQYGVDVLSNIIPAVRWASAAYDPEHFFIQSNTNTRAQVYGDFDDDQIIEIAAKLATPITVQLTPQQLKSLVGQNNIITNAIDATITTKYWTH